MDRTDLLAGSDDNLSLGSRNDSCPRAIPAKDSVPSTWNKFLSKALCSQSLFSKLAVPVILNFQGLIVSQSNIGIPNNSTSRTSFVNNSFVVSNLVA